MSALDSYRKLRADLEAELAEAKARVAEIETALGVDDRPSLYPRDPIITLQPQVVRDGARPQKPHDPFSLALRRDSIGEELLNAEERVQELKHDLAATESQQIQGCRMLADSAKKLSKPHDPVSETDWGQGIGSRNPPQTLSEFNGELAALRDASVAKRAKRNQ